MSPILLLVLIPILLLVNSIGILVSGLLWQTERLKK